MKGFFSARNELTIKLKILIKLFIFYTERITQQLEAKDLIPGQIY